MISWLWHASDYSNSHDDKMRSPTRVPEPPALGSHDPVVVRRVPVDAVEEVQHLAQVVAHMTPCAPKSGLLGLRQGVAPWVELLPAGICRRHRGLIGDDQLPLGFGEVTEMWRIDCVDHGTVPEVELDPTVALPRDDPGLLSQDRRCDGVGRSHHIPDSRRGRRLGDLFYDLDQRLATRSEERRVG